MINTKPKLEFALPTNDIGSMTYVGRIPPVGSDSKKYFEIAKRFVAGSNTTNSSKTILVSLLIQMSSFKFPRTF